MYRPQFTIRAMLVAMLVVASVCGWLTWPIECPVCHGGNVDENGRCALGENCRYFQVLLIVDDVNGIPLTSQPGHFLMRFCPACGNDGRVCRWEWFQWLDSH